MAPRIPKLSPSQIPMSLAYYLSISNLVGYDCVPVSMQRLVFPSGYLSND